MKFLYTVSVALAGTLLAAAEWIPVNIGQFHVTPGKSVTIDFSVSGEKAETVAGTLRNYSGSPAGTVTLHRCGENLYRLTHAFARGFHELEIPGAQQKFGIIALPEYSGIPDRFFGMEPLLCREKIERIRTTLDFLKRNGIVSFREYHGWHQEEPEKGRWRLYHGEAIYEEASRRDISGFFFFDRTPQWARPEGRYPTDLIGTGDSIAAMVRRRQAGLNALQIWNEPDLKRLPADQYLSLQAVASYILRAGGIDLPLVGAGFSSWQTGEETLQQYFDGKMPAFIDVFAFHSYHKPEEMLRLITTYRSYLKKVGKGGMPIWITESGKPWKRGNANPQRTYGGPHGKLRAEADEDRVSARWITLKAVEAKAGGVAGYFPFTLRSFREGPNNFGMMDFQWTPHRSLAAYFFCAQILANCDYIGDLNRLRAASGAPGSLPVPTGRRSPSSMPLENLSTFPVESCRKARCLPRMARNFVRMPLANTRWRITAISGSPAGPPPENCSRILRIWLCGGWLQTIRRLPGTLRRSSTNSPTRRSGTRGLPAISPTRQS